MKEKVAVAYEVVDHGITNSSYFSGCGTSFTDFTDVATGIGDDFAEALDDALECLAQSGWVLDIVVEQDCEGGDSVSDIAEENKKNRLEEEYQNALDEFLENNPDKTEDDFEYDGEEDDENDYPEDTYYYVSVRVREYDPDHDVPMSAH